MESADLAARARRAYEAGRLRRAAQIAWVVLALVFGSFVAVGASPVSAATGLALLFLTIALRWRGQTWGAAVRTGLTAGLIPYALLITFKCSSSLYCSLGGCMSHCVRFCGFGGLAAGVLLAMRARQHDEDIAQFMVAGTAVAALTGLLGCFVGGMTGMLWMLVGELAATIPAFALQLRQR
jgi:hypothetical protein